LGSVLLNFLVKVIDKFVPVDVMKVNGKAEIHVANIFNIEWSVSCLSGFNREERFPVLPVIVGTEVLEKRKLVSSARNRTMSGHLSNP
jgi:hypothetical protein